MAFQANISILQDPLPTCAQACLLDDSNYASSGEVGHTAANFNANSYRRVIVTNNDLSTYVYGNDNVATRDEEIPNASTNSTLTGFCYPLAEDGIIQLDYLTVPAWGNGIQYVYGELTPVVVMYDGILYIMAGEPITGFAPPLEPLAWSVIDEDDIPNKYRSTDYHVRTCDIEACKLQLGKDLFCATQAPCPSPICENQKFQSYSMIEIGLDLIPTFLEEGDIEGIRTVIAKLSTGCEECGGCTDDSPCSDCGGH